MSCSAGSSPGRKEKVVVGGGGKNKQKQTNKKKQKNVATDSLCFRTVDRSPTSDYVRQLASQESPLLPCCPAAALLVPPGSTLRLSGESSVRRSRVTLLQSICLLFVLLESDCPRPSAESYRCGSDAPRRAARLLKPQLCFSIASPRRGAASPWNGKSQLCELIEQGQEGAWRLATPCRLSLRLQVRPTPRRPAPPTL